MPPGLEQLTRLEGLWIVTQMPLRLPASLGQSLQGLHVIGKGFREENRYLQRWDWMQHYTQLRGIRMQVGPRLPGLVTRLGGGRAESAGWHVCAGLQVCRLACMQSPLHGLLLCQRYCRLALLLSPRLQGVGLAELPPEIVCMQHLTRLDLMCNQLEVGVLLRVCWHSAVAWVACMSV